MKKTIVVIFTAATCLLFACDSQGDKNENEPFDKRPPAQGPVDTAGTDTLKDVLIDTAKANPNPVNGSMVDTTQRAQ